MCTLGSSPDNPQPVVRSKLPDGPWQVLCGDLLGLLKDGSSLLIVVDYYSRWFEVRKLKNTTAGDIIRSLNTIWSIHGLPYKLTTDNGPQFTAEELKIYLKELGVSHHHTTPLWPQANGEIERQNRTILTSDFDNCNHTELVMGRRISTTCCNRHPTKQTSHESNHSN